MHVEEECPAQVRRGVWSLLLLASSLLLAPSPLPLANEAWRCECLAHAHRIPHALSVTFGALASPPACAHAHMMRRYMLIDA